jgi:hypothetical protein
MPQINNRQAALSKTDTGLGMDSLVIRTAVKKGITHRPDQGALDSPPFEEKFTGYATQDCHTLYFGNDSATKERTTWESSHLSW